MSEINNCYFLALERRPFDYMPINLALLDIGNGVNYNSIYDIDIFTRAFSKEEIIESVKRANIVTDEYLSGSLYIVELEDGKAKYKHKYKALTSDILDNFNLVNFIYNNVNNKNIMNSIIVKCSNLLKEQTSIITNLKQAIANEDVKELIRLLCELPYDVVRELSLYIVEKYNKEEKIIVRKKAA